MALLTNRWRSNSEFMENTKDRVIAFLKALDDRIDYEVHIMVLGGTALTLLDCKEFSLDVDVIILACPKMGEFVDTYVEVSKRIDVDIVHEPFTDFDSSLLVFKDYVKKSSLFDELGLKHIVIRTMAFEDIIISKYWRGLDKDMKDIENLLRHKRITRAQLEKRYRELIPQQWTDIRPKLDESRLRLFDDFGHLMR